MKTKITKKILVLVMLIALILPVQSVSGSMYMMQDTSFRTFSGRVIDDETREPVVFANVYLMNSNLGTVTNADGAFILKVPLDELNKNLTVSYLGYESLELGLSTLKPENNVLRLKALAVPLEEVVIRTEDPVELIKMAQRNMRSNYKSEPERMIAFYRETVKENRNYVVVAEAVLDVYKSSYTNDFNLDRVTIFRGRKSEDLKKMDTIDFKLQGGPRTTFLLDLVKNPGGLLSEEYFDYYFFWFSGFATIDGRNNYVIEFDQNYNVDLALYRGKIYIDAENMAFTRFEFAISDKNIADANNTLVRKKPMDMKINVLGANYMVNYRLINDKWYLNHVRSELVFQTEWRRKRFNADYVATLEMVVTDRDTINVEKPRLRDQVRTNDILVDDVSFYHDDVFWGEYNYIKPDESIESVINRLSRRLRWETMEAEEDI